MLSLVKVSLVLVSLLLVLRASEAFPLEEWLLRRSRIDGVNNKMSPDARWFNEESYTSSKRVPNEVHQLTDTPFGEERSEKRTSPQRLMQCRFGGCGK